MTLFKEIDLFRLFQLGALLDLKSFLQLLISHRCFENIFMA